MKQKLFLSLLFVSILTGAQAQRAKVNTETATGTFSIYNGKDAINARYSLMAASPDNIVLMIVPRGQFTLNAHIINTKGTELMKLKTEPVTLRYVNNLNISSLAPGNYFVEVLSGVNNDKSYRIPFTVAGK